MGFFFIHLSENHKSDRFENEQLISPQRGDFMVSGITDCGILKSKSKEVNMLRIMNSS